MLVVVILVLEVKLRLSVCVEHVDVKRSWIMVLAHWVVILLQSHAHVLSAVMSLLSLLFVVEGSAMPVLCIQVHLLLRLLRLRIRLVHKISAVLLLNLAGSCLLN